MDLYIEDHGKRRLAVELICTGCGVKFLQRKDHAAVKRNHFHSIKCHNDWQAKQLLVGSKRICTECRIPKASMDFYDRSERNGKRNLCKKCWGKKTGQYTKMKRPLARDRYRETGYNSSLKKKYGIDREAYDKLFRKQKGRCAICRQHETRMLRGRLSRLSVDHCHDTRVVRGLLCSRCNTFIGLSDYNQKRLLAAIRYLNMTARPCAQKI